ncbi:MAG: aspartyl/asparaginyl beta-hydroxylase domain-containing protein [Methylococcales bacterium]|nr:aspartyl/asparaginyl beta-hydroxylase domain-containing protein [Methylococcales bacterium]
MPSKLYYKFQYLVFSCIEKLNAVFSCVGDRTFFDASKFSWMPIIESHIEDIQQELQAVIDLETLPNIQDISPDQRVLTTDHKWKVFSLYLYGHKAEDNCKKCPKTVAVLQAIPGFKSAMFSVLAAQKHVPPHRGFYNGLLRYHLGIQVPLNDKQCGIKVGDEVQYWANGKGFVFDDTYRHEAWNYTDFTRIVLVVDFERPLYWPLSKLNQWAIYYIGKTPLVMVAMNNLRNASTQHT